MEAPEYRRVIRSASRPDERLAWFGALVSKEAGVLAEIVGGSAITLYLSSTVYVSQDVDLVGPAHAIVPVLSKWRFRRVEGRSQRTYWTDGVLGLVDLVGNADRSGLRPRHLPTPYGPVTVTAPEPLIIRRLVRAKQEGSEELFGQAINLARMKDLDWSYLEFEARYEKIDSALRRLRGIVRSRRRVPGKISS